MFLGLSTIDSSEVPLVLNLQTGSINSQYHIVFDDFFSTVESIGQDEDPPDHWDHFVSGKHYVIPNESNVEAPMHLQDDWLTSFEQEQKQRDIQQQQQQHIDTSFTPTDSSTVMNPAKLPTSSPDIIIGNLEGVSTPTIGNSEGASAPTIGNSEEAPAPISLQLSSAKPMKEQSQNKLYPNAVSSPLSLTPTVC